MSLTEGETLAWCAGFLDGEGTFGAYREGKSKYRSLPKLRLRISCAQVHLDPLEKLAEALGGKTYGPYGPYSGNRQAHYQWMVFGEAAVAAIEKLNPYLSAVKREQARLAVEAWREDYNR